MLRGAGGLGLGLGHFLQGGLWVMAIVRFITNLEQFQVPAPAEYQLPPWRRAPAVTHKACVKGSQPPILYPTHSGCKISGSFSRNLLQQELHTYMPIRALRLLCCHDDGSGVDTASYCSLVVAGSAAVMGMACTSGFGSSLSWVSSVVPDCAVCVHVITNIIALQVC